MSHLLKLVCFAYIFMGDCHAQAVKDNYVFVASSFLGIVEQADGKPYGLGVELLEQISQDLDITTSIQIVPWKRALLMAKNGSADGIIGAYHSPQRAEYLAYTTVPIYQDDMLFFSRKNLDFNWQGNFHVLDKYVFGLIRGGAYGQKFDGISAKLNIIELGSAEQQFKMLEKGRVDMIVNNSRTSPSLIRRLKLSDQIIAHFPPIESRKGYFTIAKKSKLIERLAQFNQLMLDYERQGHLQELTAQYLIPLRIKK